MDTPETPVLDGYEEAIRPVVPYQPIDLILNITLTCPEFLCEENFQRELNDFVGKLLALEEVSEYTQIKLLSIYRNLLVYQKFRDLCLVRSNKPNIQLYVNRIIKTSSNLKMLFLAVLVFVQLANEYIAKDKYYPLCMLNSADLHKIFSPHLNTFCVDLDNILNSVLPCITNIAFFERRYKERMHTKKHMPLYKCLELIKLKKDFKNTTDSKLLLTCILYHLCPTEKCPVQQCFKLAQEIKQLDFDSKRIRHILCVININAWVLMLKELRVSDFRNGCRAILNALQKHIKEPKRNQRVYALNSKLKSLAKLQQMFSSCSDTLKKAAIKKKIASHKYSIKRYQKLLLQ